MMLAGVPVQADAVAELKTHNGRRDVPFPAGSEERMMGLEPTTFCMANASDRPRPFAPVRSNRLFCSVSVHASERA